VAAAAVVLASTAPPGPLSRQGHGDIELIPASVLQSNLLVAWYGNPHTPQMGVLGASTGEALASGLAQQARAFASLTAKRVQPAYELVTVVAQNRAGADGKWRRREAPTVIEQMLAEARAHHFKLILDVQVGHSDVRTELAYVRRYLEEPDVYLALDPEFHMWERQQPGRVIGHTPAGEVNYAINCLAATVASKGLPAKVLIVHQFTIDMLPDKENIRSAPGVDVVLDMDGWGGRPLKLAIYRMVMRKPLRFAAIKLFYDEDDDLLDPRSVMALTPTPSVVIYQ
jgi:hypothetical protein